MKEILIAGLATFGLFAGLFALVFYFLKHGMDR